MTEPIAVLCSDIHLSHKPPIARSVEDDWYAAMRKPLEELGDLADGLPVICGGDLFDKWNSPPELINFAIEELPFKFCSVMGQHDLPYHSWEERKKSAFHTLEKTKIRLIDGELKVAENCVVKGFSWGDVIESEPPPTAVMDYLYVGVAHTYCWHGNHFDHSVANQGNSLGSHASRMKGYDAFLFGDNHKGFLEGDVFNAGTFYRRRSDEVDYRPMVGILQDDGSIVPYHLDTDGEKMIATTSVREAEKVILHLDSFMDELKGLGEAGLDFRKAVEREMEERLVGKAVRRIILESMEKGEG